MRAYGLGAAALAAVMCGAAHGANCALRNPDRQIYEFFPEATSYRSVVALVDADLRRRIEEQLGSGLSRSDVGKHTAYLVLKDAIPIGVVHARTEAGARGSIELVWALDLGMNIKDFRVQRSREKHTDVIQTEAFRQKMMGLDLAGIQSLLTAGNDDIDVAALQIAPSATTIAHTVVMCAFKTRLITELAFPDSILPARMLGLVHRYFPQTVTVTTITAGMSDQAAVMVAQAIGRTPDQVQRESLTLLRAVGPEQKTLGVLAFTVWSAHPARPETWWAVSPEGMVREVLVVGAVDDHLREEFSALVDADLAAVASEANQAPPSPSAYAAEVLALLAAQQIGAPADSQE